jgi:hypothetical protein
LEGLEGLYRFSFSSSAQVNIRLGADLAPPVRVFFAKPSPTTRATASLAAQRSLSFTQVSTTAETTCDYIADTTDRFALDEYKRFAGVAPDGLLELGFVFAENWVVLFILKHLVKPSPNVSD